MCHLGSRIDLRGIRNPLRLQDSCKALGCSQMHNSNREAAVQVVKVSERKTGRIGEDKT